MFFFFNYFTIRGECSLYYITDITEFTTSYNITFVCPSDSSGYSSIFYDTLSACAKRFANTFTFTASPFHHGHHRTGRKEVLKMAASVKNYEQTCRRVFVVVVTRECKYGDRTLLVRVANTMDCDQSW